MAQQPGAPRPPPAPFEKKGEVHELRLLLKGAAGDRDQQKKRDAIKKVIAYMTLGIDVSPLFSEMVMASATTDLVQKKMVYLYLVNYADSNPELAILPVNTLQKDCQDDDPMIRGLALRSLCSLSLPTMVEYMQPAALRALDDVNGYVRKTAVMSAVKIYHINPMAVTESDILPALKRLIHDNDSHVVANAICAIEEVLVEEGGFQTTKEIVTNLLNRLQQFSEWGQCAVLRLLAKYRVETEQEMFDIMNILDGLLKQSSSAVVLAVTKIFVDLTSNRPVLQAEVLNRLQGPLLTLMAAPTPELAYTVLVHVHALLTRGGDNVDVFAPQFKQFFCRYNEPSYIKSVKIDILTCLADASSAEPIVAELGEYVTDVDAEISRRAIRAIGKIAVRVPSTAEMIVGSLTGLLELDIDYVSTEAAVVMKDLVRKYPEQFQRASGAVERCIKIVSEPDGKCAVLWILGEYGLLIEDAPYLLEPMIDGFLEEPSGSVRLEMLTATVKLFFSRPPEMQMMLGNLLDKAISECQHPDVRDRGLLYYRLLQYSPEEARRIICTPKEIVEEFQEEMDMELKERVFDEFNTLSTVYKQPASKFVVSKVAGSLVMCKMQPPPLTEEEAADLVNDQASSQPAAVPYQAQSAPAPVPASANLLDSSDLLGEATFAPAAPSPPSPAAVVTSAVDDLLGMDDLLGGGPAAPAPARPVAAALTLACEAMAGPEFEGRWGRLPAQPAQMRQMLPVQVSLAAIEEVLRRSNIMIMASGAIPPGQAMKFFLYGKQATGPAAPVPGNTWFLMELVMAPGSAATFTLKAENASSESLASFIDFVWSALGAFVS